ncbi:hypothetical protein [Aeromonas veronii]|uniref:hypothetical protein n=1 Tax=Aeromonas veronii TaxID=654 RepID=UPI003D1BF391
MIIVGLAGASPAERVKMSQAVMEFAPKWLRWQVKNSVTNELSRRERLQAMLAEAKAAGVEGVIVATITPLEASLIEELGGFIWHCQGQPSSSIRIDLDKHLLVNKGGDPVGRYLPAFEAVDLTRARHRARHMLNQMRIG